MIDKPGFTENSLTFQCAGETLVGILAQPARGTSPTDLGIVIVVGGPQYRAGSHRQFVMVARALATCGVPVLRFDCRGMGDSDGKPGDFARLDEDIRAAIDALLSNAASVHRMLLWGLCDAASASLLYWQRQRDQRVTALCLINPWVRSASSLARTQVKHYYWQRLRQREFWSKLLSGGVALGAARDLLRNLRLARNTSACEKDAPPQLSFQDAMALGCRDFDGSILLMLSGKDYTAKEFLEYASTSANWRTALAHPQLRRVDLADADHTFSNKAAREQVVELMIGWLQSTGDLPPHGRKE